VKVVIDWKEYKLGIYALIGVAAVSYASSWFGAPSSNKEDPIVKATNIFDAPKDATPACVAQGVDTAPPVYASAPDPRGIDSRHVFDRLVEYDRRSGKIVPGLATQWDVSPDGLIYTFTLRKHVNFQSAYGYSPERAFNADDVLFTFSRYIIEDHPFRDTKGPYVSDYKTVDMPSVIASVTRQDTYQIRFTLSVPHKKFLSNLTMDFASIQSREYAEAMEAAGTKEAFYYHPIGTGPFAVAKFDKDTILYKTNPTYWGNGIAKENPKLLKRQNAEPEITGTD